MADNVLSPEEIASEGLDAPSAPLLAPHEVAAEGLDNSPNMSVGAPAQIQVPKVQTGPIFGGNEFIGMPKAAKEQAANYADPLSAASTVGGPLTSALQRDVGAPFLEYTDSGKDSTGLRMAENLAKKQGDLASSAKYGNQAQALEDAELKRINSGGYAQAPIADKGAYQWRKAFAQIGGAEKYDPEKVQPAAKEKFGSKGWLKTPLDSLGEVTAEQLVPTIATELTPGVSPLAKSVGQGLAKIGPATSSLLSKLARATLEGAGSNAVYSGVQGAFTDDGSPWKSALEGFTVGGALHVGGKLVTKAVEMAKPEVMGFMQEAFEHVSSALDPKLKNARGLAKVEKLQGSAIDSPVKYVEKPGPDFKPSISTFVTDAEGNTSRRFVEINLKKGTFVAHDLPANTSAEAFKAETAYPSAEHWNSPSGVGGSPGVTNRTIGKISENNDYANDLFTGGRGLTSDEYNLAMQEEFKLAKKYENEVEMGLHPPPEKVSAEGAQRQAVPTNAGSPARAAKQLPPKAALPDTVPGVPGPTLLQRTGPVEKSEDFWNAKASPVAPAVAGGERLNPTDPLMPADMAEAYVVGVDRSGRLDFTPTQGNEPQFNQMGGKGYVNFGQGHEPVTVIGESTGERPRTKYRDVKIDPREQKLVKVRTAGGSEFDVEIERLLADKPGGNLGDFAPTKDTWPESLPLPKGVIPQKLAQNEIVTPERVSEFFGDTGKDAVKRIKGWEEEGLLARQSSGQWKVTSGGRGSRVPSDVSAIPAKNGIPPGSTIFWGKNAGNEKANLGLFLGMDREGNAVVRADNNAVLRIGAKDFNDARPSNIGSGELLRVTGQVPGWTEPAQTFTPELDKALLDAQTKLDKMQKNGVIKNLVQGNAGPLKRKASDLVDNYIFNYLRPMQNFGPQIKRQSLARLLSIPRAYLADRQALMSFLSTPGKGDMFAKLPALDTLANEMDPAKRANLWAELQKTAPEITEQFKAEHARVVQEMVGNESQMSALGLTADIEGLQKFMGPAMNYSADMFAAAQNGGDWVKLLKSGEAWPEARNEYASLFKAATGKSMLPAEVDNALTDAISGAKNAKDALAEKFGTDQMPAIEKLLGSFQSTPFGISAKIAGQRAQLQLHGIWSELVNTSSFSRGPAGSVGELGPKGVVTKGDWYKVPMDPVYGPAAGGFINKDSVALIDPDTFWVSKHSTARKVGQYIKTNQVLWNVGSWLNMPARAIRGFVFMGLHEDTQYVQKAIEQYSLEKSHPALYGPAKDVHQARREGAISAGLTSTDKADFEAAGIQKQILAQFQKSLESTQSVSDAVVDTIAASRAKFGHVVDGARHTYEYLDNVGKLAGFMKHRDEELAKGMTADQAAAFATQYVNDATPNYDQVSKLERAARGGLSPLGLSSFFTAATQDVRVGGAMVGRAVKDPAVASRVAAYGMFLGGLYYWQKAISESQGIDQEKADAIWNLRPQSEIMQRNPLQTANRQSDGSIAFYDWAHVVEPLLDSLAKAPDENRAQGLIRWSLKEFVGNVAAPLATKGFEGAGVLNPHTPWQGPGGVVPSDLMSTLETASNAGILPTTAGRVARAVKHTTDKLTPTDQPWTPGTAAQYAVGLPVSGVGINPDTPNVSNPAELRLLMEQKRQAGDFKGQFARGLSQSEKGPGGQSARDAAREIAKQNVLKAVENNNRRKALVRKL